MFPLEWCEWWFDEIVLQFPTYYNSMSITEPQSIFMDRNKELEKWNEGIKSQKLISIDNVCNQFLLPNVLCPWEYSDFIQNVRYVDLDTAMQKLIQKCNFLLLMYQSYLKYETRAMTISENPIMTMICGYTILIIKHYQKFLLLMDTLAF